MSSTGTINNEKYFEVLDPNTPSEYYLKYNDNMIDSIPPAWFNLYVFHSSVF